jgi:hypothetical protein
MRFPHALFSHSVNRCLTGKNRSTIALKKTKAALGVFPEPLRKCGQILELFLELHVVEAFVRIRVARIVALKPVDR